MRKVARNIKAVVPPSVRWRLWPLKTFWTNPLRWLGIASSGVPRASGVHLFYGHDRIPGRGEFAHGGIVKFQRLQEVFPNSPRAFNILYMGSSSMPSDFLMLLWLARKKGAHIVWNQDGVGYPGVYGSGWQWRNEPMRRALRAADHVFYQSVFSKQSADRFAGRAQGSWEILYNSVDTSVFVPARSDPSPGELVMLLGGNQYQYYRLESAIQTLAAVARAHPRVRLLVTGRLNWLADEVATTRIARQLADRLEVGDRVEFIGPYTQHEAPGIMQRAHLLLHTKYNDPCPGLVLEAMACGLPVVYSSSGGVPELVGEHAGVGIPCEQNWERDLPPDPVAMADGVMRVMERRAEFVQAARQRAMECFDIRPWIQRHKEVFEGLIA